MLQKTMIQNQKYYACAEAMYCASKNYSHKIDSGNQFTLGVSSALCLLAEFWMFHARGFTEPRISGGDFAEAVHNLKENDN